MKVALVVPGGVDRSGEVRVIPALLALTARLAADHEVHVFATHQEAEPGSWRLCGATVHNAGARRRSWRGIADIVTEHRKGPFDIVHAFWAGLPGALAVGAGRLLRVPSIVHVAGGELVSLDDIGYGGARKWHTRTLVRTVLRMATVVTCASAPMLELVADAGVMARRLPLGVDLRRWPPRPPARRRPDEPARLVHVASLNHVKDQPTLLRALHLLAGSGHSFHLDVVGEDTLGGRIQALAAELKLDQQVAFHGFLTQRALRPIVEAAHVAVMSSRHEAGPLATLEAAVVGVPTAGTAVGHIAEWAPRAALAARCGDAAALAAAIGALLDDEDLRMNLAVEAARRAAAEDAEHTARACAELYGSLAAGQRR
jgi:glycosyltransferase involved in cell wall biosynthesis